MSDTRDIPRWRPPPPDPARDAVEDPSPPSTPSIASVLLIGGALLLSGLCAVTYCLRDIYLGTGDYFALFLTGLLLGFVGIVLIRKSLS